MSIRRLALAALAFAALAACAASPQELAAEDDGRCRGYGFAPPSEGYKLCRMQLDRDRRATQAAALGDAAAELGASARSWSERAGRVEGRPGRF